MRQRFDKPALNFFGDTFGILNWISKGPIVEFRPTIKIKNVRGESPLSPSSQSRVSLNTDKYGVIILYCIVLFFKNDLDYCLDW